MENTLSQNAVSEQQVYRCILELSSEAPDDSQAFSPEVTSFADLGIDSFGVLECVVRLERELGLRADAKMLTHENTKNLQAFARAILDAQD